MLKILIILVIFGSRVSSLSSCFSFEQKGQKFGKSAFRFQTPADRKPDRRVVDELAFKKTLVVDRLGRLAVSGFADHYPNLTPGASGLSEEHPGL